MDFLRPWMMILLAGADAGFGEWADAGFGESHLKNDIAALQENYVEIDLNYGFVRGYSPYIDFLESPTTPRNKKCSSQAVIKIDFSGKYKGAKIFLEYGDKPRLWSLDISDSPTGDGYGGDNGTTSNMAEVQIHNKQLRIYGNSLPGYLDASKNGGLLLQLYDNIVKKGSRLHLDLSDERLEWTHNGKKQYLESKFLFTLTGQDTQHGEREQYVYIGFNRVVHGAHRHGSGLCHVAISLYELSGACQKGNHNCAKDAICSNSRRSFKCKCKPGFYGNGVICEDTDECDFENGGCVHSCRNSVGNYSCTCKSGFQLANDHHNCLDVNECLESRGGCQHQCMNTLGRYECKCNAGFSLNDDGRSCKLSLWCRERYGCAQRCKTTVQGISCACYDGYRLHLNRRDCIRTCSVGNGGCQHICKDGKEGPECSCAPLYLLKSDKSTCIASCGVNNGGCERKCKDTKEGPICNCPIGFALHQDGRSCLDTNECDVNNGGCSHECVNTRGSYECICPKGFKVQMDQETCKDINECSMNSTCDHICINTPGSFRCACRPGYQQYGLSHCADINECSISNGGCRHICKNTLGGHQCHCHHGYKLHPNTKDCLASEQCIPLKVPAKSTLICRTYNRNQECTLQCHSNAEFMAPLQERYAYACGPDTQYLWTHEKNNQTLPSCSEVVESPSFKRKARFFISADRCDLKKQNTAQVKESLSMTLNDHKKYQCIDLCQVNYVNLKCSGTRRRRFRQILGKHRTLIQAEFELQMQPQPTTASCNVQCVKKITERRLKKTIKRLRKSINKEQFYVRFENNQYEVTRRSFKAARAQMQCSDGSILVNERCVSCSVGTYYEGASRSCRPCPEGTYQDVEGQLKCVLCPAESLGSGIIGAKNLSECAGRCNPGFYSEAGLEPCTPCNIGFYQPEYGRTTCISCGSGITTRQAGSTGFQDCLVREVCRPGYFFDIQTYSCQPCERGTYQPKEGQNFCIFCPGTTMTDFNASKESSDCKDKTCGWHFKDLQGFIKTPNYPGNYPNNIECTWTIDPEKGRRILVIIPEIFLPAEDKCGDKLVMRKSPSPYSKTTYETCESTKRPTAFTARSTKLWIQFKADSQNTAGGFSIPFVTYNEEYQGLIEDIVRDGRLYSSYQHQEILKDRKLLSALLEVIATPYNYFKYANVSRTMFPRSFIRLLTPKVRRFFSEG